MRLSIIPSIALEDQRFSFTHLKVLSALGKYADKNGWAYPSLAKIAGLIGVSRQRVSKCVSELREWGYIESFAQMRKDGSGQTSNLYRIKYDVGLPDADFDHGDHDDEGFDIGEHPATTGCTPATTGCTPRNFQRLHPPQLPEVAPPATSRGCTINAPLNAPANAPVEAGASAPAAAPAKQEKPEAYLERITRHENARQPVTMTPDWKPGEQFKALMMRAGIRPDALTDALLAKFQIHHNGESKPQNKWESALVTWCKRERPETNQLAPENNPDFDYPLHVSQKRSESAVSPEKAKGYLDKMRQDLGCKEEVFR